MNSPKTHEVAAALIQRAPARTQLTRIGGLAAVVAVITVLYLLDSSK
jgi:hypothetical protein